MVEAREQVCSRVVGGGRRRDLFAVGVEGAVSERGGKLLLELGVEIVLHPLGCIVQVVARQVEMGVEVGFPEAMGSNQAAGGGAAGVSQLEITCRVGRYPADARETPARKQG